MCVFYILCVFFFKQKTAYEMRISDWSSDVCSSDLFARLREQEIERDGLARPRRTDDREVAEVACMKIEEIGSRRRRLEQGDRIAPMVEIGRASCRERVCKYV